MLRILFAAACLTACSAQEPPAADPSMIVAAVDHAELELERSRGGVAERDEEALPQ
jgi:uncharacterized lipoprotein YbaY